MPPKPRPSASDEVRRRRARSDRSCRRSAARRARPRADARRVLERREHRPVGVEPQPERGSWRRAGGRSARPRARRAGRRRGRARGGTRCASRRRDRPPSAATGAARPRRPSRCVIAGARRRSRARREAAACAGALAPRERRERRARSREQTAGAPGGDRATGGTRGRLLRARPPRGRARREVPVRDGAGDVLAAAAQRVVREPLAAIRGASRDDELDQVRLRRRRRTRAGARTPSRARVRSGASSGGSR